MARSWHQGMSTVLYVVIVNLVFDQYVPPESNKSSQVIKCKSIVDGLSNCDLSLDDSHPRYCEMQR